MVIYADILFLLNAVIDYLLLLISAKTAGTPLKRIRFGLGAALGGAYAVFVFLPGFSFLNRAFYKVLFCLMMLLIAYGVQKMLVKQILVFIALTCALGGGVMAIGMMDAVDFSLGKAVIYSIPDLKVVILSAALCYALLSLVMPKLMQHTSAESEIRNISFDLFERRIQVSALLDTGNTLTDPVTGYVVPVAEGEVLGVLFPAEFRPEKEDLLDPVHGMTRLNRGVWKGRFRLLPYRAVGVERGLLLAVKMDSIILDGQKQPGTLVALSPTPVSDGGNYRVLTGG